MPTQNAATIDAVTEEIINLVQAEVEAVDITADSTIQSRGLDSLKIMSLIFKIEERYDIFLEDEDADHLLTVGDLAALVLHRVREQS
jgi:acyl carrier protein